MENFSNPFEGIVTQMNNAKANYDQTMAGLQNQLRAIQQNMYNMQQSMYQPSGPYQQPAPAPSAPAQQPSPFEQEMALLCEIKNGIVKNNELMQQFFTGVPCECKEKNEKKDESDKKQNLGKPRND